MGPDCATCGEDVKLYKWKDSKSVAFGSKTNTPSEIQVRDGQVLAHFIRDWLRKDKFSNYGYYWGIVMENPKDNLLLEE